MSDTISRTKVVWRDDRHRSKSRLKLRATSNKACTRPGHGACIDYRGQPDRAARPINPGAPRSSGAVNGH